jgi:hypothetical protein
MLRNNVAGDTGDYFSLVAPEKALDAATEQPVPVIVRARQPEEDLLPRVFSRSHSRAATRRLLMSAVKLNAIPFPIWRAM